MPSVQARTIDRRDEAGHAIPGNAGQIVARLLDLIASRGGNVNGILRTIGISASLDDFRQNFLPHLDHETLQRLSARSTVELADIQARAAGRQPFRGTDWRLLFYCLIGSRNLGEAIGRAAELFSAIDGRMGQMVVQRKGDRVSLFCSGGRSDDNELDFTVILIGQVMYHSVFSWLIGKSLGGLLKIDFPQVASRCINVEHLPFAMQLGAERQELQFSAALLDQPVVRTMVDCEVLPTLGFMAGFRMDNDPLELARRSRHFLVRALQEKQELPSFEHLARHLAIGPVTLRRRLSSVGTSYREIRDSLRREMAVALVTGSRMSVEEIAARLDLCDSNALRRAFHAWTGMSPTAFRQSSAIKN